MSFAWLQKLSPFAPLPLRLVLGIIFFAHGAQKMLGWYGGSGLQGFAGFMKELGLNPPILFAILGAGGEFFGGILVFLGLFTRFGGFLIVNTMLVAIFAVHWSGGLFADNGGFEYPLALLAAGVSLMLSGGGALSLDSLIKIQWRK